MEQSSTTTQQTATTTETTASTEDPAAKLALNVVVPYGAPALSMAKLIVEQPTIDTFFDFSYEPASAAAYYEQLELGLPAAVIEAAIEGCHIDYQSAADAKASLNQYFEVLYTFDPKLTGGKTS